MIATKFKTTIEVEAMRWGGTRAGVEAICGWARSKLRDDQRFQDAPVSYIFTGADDVADVVVWTDEGDERLETGDWVVHVASDCFRVVKHGEFLANYRVAMP